MWVGSGELQLSGPPYHTPSLHPTLRPEPSLHGVYLLFPGLGVIRREITFRGGGRGRRRSLIWPQPAGLLSSAVCLSIIGRPRPPALGMQGIPLPNSTVLLSPKHPSAQAFLECSCSWHRQPPEESQANPSTHSSLLSGSAPTCQVPRPTGQMAERTDSPEGQEGGYTGHSGCSEVGSCS